jgi:DNA-binding HxlR family transcriptional regulator
MVEYSLSETVLEIIPFITHLKEWGDKKIENDKNKSAENILPV